MRRDISLGSAGEPVELTQVDLSSVLLVDMFGIWELHGNATERTVRAIHNFKANFVNEHAWLPHRLKYDHFAQLDAALRVLHAEMNRNANDD